jgi:superfamily II DNA helicase RecQ/superfamily I DNA/RNA helicase/cold shock CspA family protein
MRRSTARSFDNPHSLYAALLPSHVRGSNEQGSTTTGVTELSLQKSHPSVPNSERGGQYNLRRYLLRFPFLASVERLVEDRGFGFAKCGQGNDDFFFHASSNPTGRGDFVDITTGDLLLCQIGSRPKEPTRKCIVQWVLVADIDWEGKEAPKCQGQLDAYRIQVLGERSLKQLHQQMEANWYAKQWGGKAPADLTDSLLESAWIEQLSQLDPDALRQAEIANQLRACRFDFRNSFDPERPQFPISALLAKFSPEQLAVLAAPHRKWLALSGVIDERQKSDILEWSIHRYIGGDSNHTLEDWLEGRAAYEAATAQRLLDRGAPLPAIVSNWMVALAEDGLIAPPYVDRLAASDPQAAVSLFGKLSDDLQRQIQMAWIQDSEPLAKALVRRPELAGRIAHNCALAVDLETDGEKIWEIGCAGMGPSSRLHDASQGTDMNVALADLDTRIQDASLIVGHNILAWDWPILAARLPSKSTPLIWDTMLVQYLLDPQARSYALGGKHHAEADAEATLELFAEQLRKIPASLTADILVGRFESTIALIHAISSTIGDLELPAQPIPDFIAGTNREVGELLLLPEHELSNMGWLSGISVIQANPEERLPRPLWQIDVDILKRELAEKPQQSPFVHALIATCQRAQRAQIALRRSMLPTWLLEGPDRLSEAVDKACFVPAQNEGKCFAPIPRSSDWWGRAEGLHLHAMLPEGPVVIVDREASTQDNILAAEEPRHTALIRISTQFSDKWLSRDAAAQILDVRGGWRSFRTVKVPASIKVIKRSILSSRKRPILAARQYPALFPGSSDQASYWTSILEALCGISHCDAIPVLLIASTESPSLMQMLSTACAEIGIAELRPTHRSRREHLLRASDRGLVVVDTIDRWRAWQDIADETGLVLQPIVEALPVEEWFALDDAATRDSSASSREMNTEAPSDPVSIPEAKILKGLPKLTEQFLTPWLEQVGLGESERAAILLDTRADAINYQLRAFFEKLPVSDAPWSDEVRNRLNLAFAPLQIQREEAPSDLEALEKFLVTNWQPPGKSGGNAVSGFKPNQKDALESIRTRTNDVMVTLPTGEGKSVLFQVPGLCRGLRNRRLTLVISPLKALMRDQVVRLHEQGFVESVDYISSDRPRFELAEVLQGVLDHRIVMLYVAPERLRNAVFLDVLRRRMDADGGLEYVVFDEAHCVNQWGYEFRPDYFHSFNYLLHSLRDGNRPDATPFLLLSATLTASDRRGIRDLLERGVQDRARLPLSICPDPSASTNPLRSHIEVEPVSVQGNILDSQDFETALPERLPHILAVIREAQQNRRATEQRSAVIIFVTRRAHADDLARRLTEYAGCDVESYHAGLDAATREDIYTRFRDGDLDVLVATKAFGMGMDIPDIHWIVHLTPPSYLEDYLQEVGRIGRGSEERKRARLDKLKAIMLGSPTDFENMRGLRATSELQSPQIDETERKIIEVAETIEGQKVAFVPQHGFEPYRSAAQRRANETRLRMAIYWLEKAGHLKQLGMVPDLLSVELFPKKLSEIGSEQSQIGQVANAILSVALGTNRDDGYLSAQSTAQSSGLFGGILNWISSLVGLRVYKADSAPEEPAISPSNTDAMINISQIRRQCQIKSMEETMACLVDLQHRGALQLRWTLDFAKRPLLSEPPAQIAGLIASVGNAVRTLINQLRSKKEIEFNPFDYLDDPSFGFPTVEQAGSLSNKEQTERQNLLRRYERSYLYAFRSLARASGVRMKQVVRGTDEGILWFAQLPNASQMNANRRCEELLILAPSLLSLFYEAQNADLKAVEVHSLIRRMVKAHPQKRFHLADLEAILRLLSALNLVSAQPELVPLSYVLVLTDTAPGLDQHPELVEELNDVNELAETRNFAMEVFANLPKSARETFINGYFSKANAAELKVFLDTQLGEIENEGDEAKGFIAAKRDQLRATKATEFFERFQKSEEPAQWQAMCHRFDQHLIVNAGPGAGKTSVLVGRIAHLIREQHIKPAEIVVLAFNRAVVFEIRTRIRELFRTLGYAAYASQVRVSTFHGLARRSLADTDGNGTDMNNLLGTFASRMRSDAAFREQVAAGCRCILVDEFQDVTEDVYSIIRNLHRGSGKRAGVMVIGDDDQDILRWQRRSHTSSPREEFAEEYFERFKADFGGEALRSLELCVNFRSGAEIVKVSQRMIDGFFEKSTRSRRLKQTLLRQASTAGDSRCERIDARGWKRDDIVNEIVRASLRLHAENPGSLAILCRTNDEVAELHRQLAVHFPAITVQSSENMRIADLRHIALWCDFLEIEVAKEDRTLSSALLHKLSEDFRMSTNIPEANADTESLGDLTILWDLCCEESIFPHLSTLLRFIKNLQRDELQRLVGGRKGDHEVIISTIHKVKGLEYDNVIVSPSQSAFGSQPSWQPILEDDAAEEARLLYVALTRAKSRLVYFVGDREHAWGNPPPRKFEGELSQGKVLTGAHNQVDLGWAMRRSAFNSNPDDCQSYIENVVQVGDPILLEGTGVGTKRSLVHRNASGEKRQIGCIAKKFGAGTAESDLKVSAIVRYPVDQRNPDSTGDLVDHRGWGYAVLVAGRLR